MEKRVPASRLIRLIEHPADVDDPRHTTVKECGVAMTEAEDSSLSKSLLEPSALKLLPTAV
jgi:hypothetical protein